MDFLPYIFPAKVGVVLAGTVRLRSAAKVIFFPGLSAQFSSINIFVSLTLSPNFLVLKAYDHMLPPLLQISPFFDPGNVPGWFHLFRPAQDLAVRECPASQPGPWFVL